jgi:hypothetical protein
LDDSQVLRQFVNTGILHSFHPHDKVRISH